MLRLFAVDIKSEKEAYKAMNKLNNNPDFADCWVTKIQE